MVFWASSHDGWSLMALFVCSYWLFWRRPDWVDLLLDCDHEEPTPNKGNREVALVLSVSQGALEVNVRRELSLNVNKLGCKPTWWKIIIDWLTTGNDQDFTAVKLLRFGVLPRTRYVLCTMDGWIWDYSEVWRHFHAFIIPRIRVWTKCFHSQTNFHSQWSLWKEQIKHGK